MRVGTPALSLGSWLNGNTRTIYKNQVSRKLVHCSGASGTFKPLPSGPLSSERSCPPRTTVALPSPINHEKTWRPVVISHASRMSHRNPSRLACVSHQFSFARDLQLRLNV